MFFQSKCKAGFIGIGCCVDYIIQKVSSIYENTSLINADDSEMGVGLELSKKKSSSGYVSLKDDFSNLQDRAILHGYGLDVLKFSQRKDTLWYPLLPTTFPNSLHVAKG